MEKSNAREYAMKTLFAASFGAEQIPDPNEEGDTVVLSARDRKFADELISGIRMNEEEISKVIADYSQGWSIERIGKVELCILKIAVYEILFLPEVPVGASVNEAVELAKTYCDDKSPSFINGILGSVGRKYRI